MGSLGNSSIFMESSGHRILFSVKGVPGFIEIKRKGWFSFDYLCNVGGDQLPELTEKVTEVHEESYDVKIAEHRSGSDGYSEDVITWYLVDTTRISDGQTNTVHRCHPQSPLLLAPCSLLTCRRFKDFVNLNSDVCENFRGHQLFSRSASPTSARLLLILSDHSLPAFPQKKLKLGCSFPPAPLTFPSPTVTDHTDPAFLTQRESQLQVS